MKLVIPPVLAARALAILNQSFGSGTPTRIEYHARRTEADPKKWRVVEVTVLGGSLLDTHVNELATDLKRNRAEALVKLLRSNKQES
jgi:ABC-type transporter MlaC component